MPTIGEKLKSQIDAREAAKVEAERERTARAKRTEERERAKIARFFEETLQDLIDAVQDGVEFKGRKLKDTYSAPFAYNRGGSFQNTLMVWEEGHPHHDIFTHNAAKARIQGLEWTFTYEHDGMGMESWYRVNLKPLAEYGADRG